MVGIQEKKVASLNLSTKSRQFKKSKPQSQEPQSYIELGFCIAMSKLAYNGYSNKQRLRSFLQENQTAYASLRHASLFLITCNIFIISVFYR